MIGEGTAENINDSIGTVEKKSSTHFSKAKRKFCLSLHYNHDLFFVIGKEIFKGELSAGMT